MLIQLLTRQEGAPRSGTPYEASSWSLMCKHCHVTGGRMRWHVHWLCAWSAGDSSAAKNRRSRSKHDEHSMSFSCRTERAGSEGVVYWSFSLSSSCHQFSRGGRRTRGIQLKDDALHHSHLSSSLHRLSIIVIAVQIDYHASDDHACRPSAILRAHKESVHHLGRSFGVRTPPYGSTHLDPGNRVQTER